MNKKKTFTLISLLCIITALLMFVLAKKETGLYDYFWIPLVLAAVFLFTATRYK